MVQEDVVKAHPIHHPTLCFHVFQPSSFPIPVPSQNWDTSWHSIIAVIPPTVLLLFICSGDFATCLTPVSFHSFFADQSQYCNGSFANSLSFPFLFKYCSCIDKEGQVSSFLHAGKP